MESDSPPAEQRMNLRILSEGVVPYRDALEMQDRLLLERQSGLLPDTLMFLEHPPTITFGSRARPEHLLASEAELQLRGVEVVETRRGGDITFHGPGQLVCYPFLDLRHYGRDVHAYLRNLEEVLIRTLATFGLKGRRSPGETGVWVGEEKIAAIGVEVKRWVTRHGFALNLTTDLSYFELIIPCGICDKGVTSIQKCLGASPNRYIVEAEIVRQFLAVFEIVYRPDTGGEVATQLLSAVPAVRTGQGRPA